MSTRQQLKLIKEILKSPYARVFIPEEDGGFSTSILEFRGCFSQGDNLQEAYTNLESAAESWLLATLAQKQPIPEPLVLQQCGLLAIQKEIVRLRGGKNA